MGYFTPAVWGRAVNLSGMTADKLAEEIADLISSADDERVRLNAIRLLLQHSRDVLRFSQLLGEDRLIRVLEIGAGKERVKMTQIEQALRLAHETTGVSRNLLVEANQYLTREQARQAALPVPEDHNAKP
jgi:hypothetical protein